MKHLLFTGLICLFSICLMAQSKDCKFVKLKNAQGQISDGVMITSQFGKLYVLKWEGKFAFTYEMRDFYKIMADDKNMTVLKIDSVEFFFTNNLKVTVKVNGSGSIKNSNNKLKPVFDTINFNGVIASDVIEKYFSKAPLKGFLAHGEKDAVLGDSYNEKQQAQSLQAITCLQSQ